MKGRMRETVARGSLATVASMLWLFASAAPVAAQSRVEAQLELLRAERLLAAEAALAKSSHAPRVPLAELVPAEVDPEPSLSPPAAWQERLAPEAWSLLSQTFKAEGVPREFLSVGWVESRFQASALSARGARGIWQLMPETARSYGLEVNGVRDDRTALAASTQAAARYLADLHRQFGDWLLALAAYNAGPGRVEAAMTRARSRDFWRLRAWLPAETQQYVPAVLDARGLPFSAGLGEAPGARSQQ